jgi:DHA1 family tetracycline resistance protein-like MFS transporter
MDPFVGVRNIIKAFTISNLRTMFIVSFVITFGFNLFLQFFSFYLLDKFKMTQVEAGNFFAYAGLWIAISQGIIAGPVAKKFKATKVISPATILLAISVVSLIFPTQYHQMLLILPFVAIFQGLVVPNIAAVLSDLTDESSQGEVMGINQSLASFTQIVPPIIAGFLFAIGVDLPIIFAGIIILIGWVIFEYGFNRRRKQVFVES